MPLICIQLEIPATYGRTVQSIGGETLPPQIFKPVRTERMTANNASYLGFIGPRVELSLFIHVKRKPE